MRSPEALLCWQWCIESMHSSVNQDKPTLEIVQVPSIKVKDSFLRLKKKKGHTLDLTAVGRE